MFQQLKVRRALSRRHVSRVLVLSSVFVLLGFASGLALYGQFVATDPGVRGGSVGAGAAIPGLTPAETTSFNDASDTFREVDSVKGTLPGEKGAGLGPRFNLNSSAGCHAQPDVGGTSPSTNPQVAVANLDGATNQVPFFIATTGPVREARFKFNPNGTRDGGVHDLFTITGRTDAVGCNIAQPDFNVAAANNNLIFRIPTPLFGGSLIETIQDATILANRNSNLAAKQALGINGHPNFNGNDGSSQNCQGPQPGNGTTPEGFACNSEANAVINTFNALSQGQQQDILNFLRSL